MAGWLPGLGAAGMCRAAAAPLGWESQVKTLLAPSQAAPNSPQLLYFKLNLVIESPGSIICVSVPTHRCGEGAALLCINLVFLQSVFVVVFSFKTVI